MEGISWGTGSEETALSQGGGARGPRAHLNRKPPHGVWGGRGKGQPALLSLAAGAAACMCVCIHSPSPPSTTSLEKT